MYGLGSKGSPGKLASLPGAISSFRFMVDAADHEKLDAAKNELHSLLDKPQLAGIPVS